MSADIESRLRTAYLRNGGSETSFEAIKGELIAQYRRQVVVNEVIEEGSRPLTMNELLRDQLQESRHDDGIRRLFANQKGNPDAA